MKKSVIPGLVILAAVAALAAAVIWQRGELRKARAIAVQAQSRAQASEARAAEAKSAVRSVQTEEQAVLQHLRTAEAKFSAAQASNGSVNVSRSSATSDAGASNASPFVGIAKMVKNPGMKAMIRAQSQGQLDMMYGSLFKGLSLSVENQEAFKSLLLDKQMAMVDLSLGLMDGSSTPEQQKEAAAKIAEANKSYDAQIKTLIGDDNFALYQDYETTQPERMQVNMFKQSLVGAEALSEQQEHDLIRALYDERKAFPEIAKQYSQTNPPDPATFTEASITNQLAMLAKMQEKNTERAAKVLTAAQLVEFKKSQEQMRAMQEMGLKMAAQMFGQGKSAGQ